MTSIYFKKTREEKITLKKAKKDYFKYINAIKPGTKKENALFGFKTNQMSQIGVILDLANKAKAVLMS